MLGGAVALAALLRIHEPTPAESRVDSPPPAWPSEPEEVVATEAAPHLPDWPAPAGMVPSAGAPRLRAASWYVVDDASGTVLTSREADTPRPIASITKLMGALVWADAGVPDETIVTITRQDRDFFQVTKSHLTVGMSTTAGDLLHLALLSSDNRAMMALLRSTGLTVEQFAARMNRRARELGLSSARFTEPTGLDARNEASPRDAALLLEAASRHPRLAPLLGLPAYTWSRTDRARTHAAPNSNRLARSSSWDVLASKTGFTLAAGSCLVMKTRLSDGRTVSLALVGVRGGATARYPDALRLRAWLEGKPEPRFTRQAGRSHRPAKGWKNPTGKHSSRRVSGR